MRFRARRAVAAALLCPPDRARPIPARGRAYAESRFICGAHNESAVEAGMASASAKLTVVRTEAEFQQNLAARAQLAALRASPDSGKPAGCEIDADLVAQRVMPVLDGAKP